MTRRPITVLLGDPSIPDETKPGGRFGQEDLETVTKMRAALESLGAYEVTLVDRHDALMRDLADARPRLVINFCDTGFKNHPFFELHVAALLEMHGIPYSGAGPAAMAICFDKALVRSVADDLGVPVPHEAFFDRAGDAIGRVDRFPAFIKPNQADGSLGITKDAIVHDAAQAEAYLRRLSVQLPDHAVLVQEFLDGPEYGVGVLGNPEVDLEVLPPLEADYSALDSGLPHLLGYESKTDPTSPYWNLIQHHPAKLDATTRAELDRHAARLCDRLGCRDYGRFDFRVGSDGVAKLLEVNPNPAWSYDGRLALMAQAAGYDYAGMLDRIIGAAEHRLGLS